MALMGLLTVRGTLSTLRPSCPRLRFPGRSKHLSSSARSQAAVAEAVAVARAETTAHNPLFLYGPTGAGKSHVLNAIAYEMRGKNPERHVLVIPAEDLRQQLVHAIRFDQMDAFDDWLAGVDALLIDDFPCSDGKERTREESFWKLELVVKRRVPVVVVLHVASDDAAAIANRIRSGFKAAEVIELGYPDASALREIAQRTARFRRLAVSESVLDRIARHSSGNPCEVHRALSRLAAAQLLHDGRGIAQLGAYGVRFTSSRC